MLIERDEAIASINEAREKIVDIKKKLEEKNNEIPKLQYLKEQFDSIYFILGKRQTDLQRDWKDLSMIGGEIQERRVVLLSKQTELM